jgi:hypothetical protein
MAAMNDTLRGRLERTVIEAREVAETGARAALEALAVHHHEPFPHQTPEQRKLRNHLRARARQAGDQQNHRGEVEIKHLASECAYEYWHRMLFARFLAENHFLIEPESGVAISLEECEELAREAGTDTWTFASRCAQSMLPQIFRPDDPLLQVAFAREHRSRLEALLIGLDAAVFVNDDALGWVYQFWQSKRKDEVNADGGKIDADGLPPVTQLFTEHYMVLFLLHNTLGAWHANKCFAQDPRLATDAPDEEFLQKAVALKIGRGYSFDYLRFVRGENSPWRPAASAFGKWPSRAAELKVLDPCCGSGHFLTAAFELLVLLRMQQEDLSVAAAVDAVLRDNLFGLELDARCTQIAAFNLALSAWKMAGFRPLPPMHLACSGMAVGSTREQWMQMLAKQGSADLRFFFGQLYDLFSKAPTLGSLINPHRFFGSGMVDKVGMEKLFGALTISMAEIENQVPERHELGVTAQGLTKAVELLAGKYHLVITNVPYLGRGKQDDILRKHLEEQYPLAKADLATAFIFRSLEFCVEGGSTALVTPQNWLFLTTYTKMRQNLLEQRVWNLVARLGEHAFESGAAAGAFAAMVILSASYPEEVAMMAGIDVSAPRGQRPIYAPEKATFLRGAKVEEAASPCSENEKIKQQQNTRDTLPGIITTIPQSAQLKNPDARITGTVFSDSKILQEYAEASHGVGTFDSPRFTCCFWEIQLLGGGWFFQQSTPEKTQQFGGCHFLLRWEDGKGSLADLMNAKQQAGYSSGKWRAGVSQWGNLGVLSGQMGTFPCTIYLGYSFDDNASVIIPRSAKNLLPLWAFCSSDKFAGSLRTVDQKINITCKTLVKVPFDLEHWKKVAEEGYPNGLPEPESDDPTQWLFHGLPGGHVSPVPQDASVALQVAVARVLGYRWPAETDSKMRLSVQARDLVSCCDKLTRHVDDDGIVCIPAVRGEDPAADRLLAILSDCGVKPNQDLDDWLRNSFFEEHCKLFHHRPFIWHIWDGRRRDGFHALVNYHRLAEPGGKGRKLLESLTYSYLGEWITRQQDGVKRGEGGADDRLIAAQELQKRLVAILAGEPPFDLFIRWKSLSQQPIGWDPDINDGVRLNMRPFLVSDIPGGRAGAGILRWKPNIKWDKDRGKEPKRPRPDFPWFWGWDGTTADFMGTDTFTGDRHNACHYTLTTKQRVRDGSKETTEKGFSK